MDTDFSRAPKFAAHLNIDRQLHRRILIRANFAARLFGSSLIPEICFPTAAKLICLSAAVYRYCAAWIVEDTRICSLVLEFKLVKHSLDETKKDQGLEVFSG